MTDHTASALTRLLEVSQASVFDYARDFNMLWTMRDLGPRVVVVWVDTPTDHTVHPVATDPHLSPFDWALAARVANPTLSVTIVDLKPAHRAEFAAVRWFLTLRAGSVPWLRRVTAAVLAEAGTPERVQHVLTGAIPADAHQVNAFEALRALPVCREDRTVTASHHAIANLIGPMLLNVGESAELAPDHRAAIRQLLTVADVLPRPDAKDQGAVSGAPDLDIASEFRSVLLVDDMAALGWADFARRFWPSGLTVQTSPEKLVLALEETERNALLVDGKPVDLLLLDLRLTNSTAAAAELGRRLRVLVPRDSGLWEGRRIVAPVRDDSDVEELTLLPRLLANAFPDLPIILFSTTLRRDVVERLRPFDNIITEFGKPRLADGEQGAARALDGFGRALEQAEVIQQAARVRSIVRRASGVIGAPRIGEGASCVDVFIEESGRFETRTSVIAALVLEYRGDVERLDRELTDALWAANLLWGLDRENLDEDGNSRVPTLPPEPDARIQSLYQLLPKGDVALMDEDALRRATGAIQEVFWGLGIQASAIFAIVPALDMDENDSCDLSYRRSLAFILELLLAEVIDREATVRVDVASRVRPVVDPQDEYARFGRTTVKNTNLVFAFNVDEVHPIVEEIVERRGLRSPARARGSTLHTNFLFAPRHDEPVRAPARKDTLFVLRDGAPRAEEDVNRRLMAGSGVGQHKPRQIHYLADWTADVAERLTRKHGFLRDQPTLARWFGRGFGMVDGVAARRLLDGLRLCPGPQAKRVDVPMALELCADAIDAGFPDGPPPHLATALVRLADVGATADGRRGLRRHLAARPLR